MRQTTIIDIAKKLDISPSTVSRALSNHPDISQETKARVRAAADEMDYRPNTIAQNLQKKQSQIIGVVVPQVKHYFFAEIMAGVTDVAYQAGYTVMICQSNEDFEREKSNIDVLISHRVAGLLVSVSSTTTDCHHFQRLVRRGMPLVFFDRVCDHVEASTVVVDDMEGAFRATEYLIWKGYQRIAHMAGPPFLSISRLRRTGYENAMRQCGRPVHPEWIIQAGLNEEDGTSAAEAMLSRLNPLPDALFCVNDPVALGAFVKFKERGVRVQADMALVGFTDGPIASMIDPALTTVRQPAYLLGKSAAELLLEQIRHRESRKNPVHKVLKKELIIRQSA